MPQVHVVERRPGHRHRGRVDPRSLQGPEHDRDRGGAVIAAGRDVAPGDDHVPYFRQAGQHGADQVGIGAGGQLHLHRVAAQLAL